MEIEKFIELKDSFELQKYVGNMDSDKKNCSSFYGSPKKHPYAEDRVILVSDPFGSHPFYYDFKLEDVQSVEEQPRITDMAGDAVAMVRIWVKQSSIGITCTPFVVGDTR